MSEVFGGCVCGGFLLEHDMDVLGEVGVGFGLEVL